MDPFPDSAQNLPGWPADSWIDPQEEQTKFRRRLQRFRLGFTLLGLALVVASLLEVGELYLLFFTDIRQPLGAFLGVPHFHLISGGIITWVSLLGVCLLTGPWPDIHWQRRSGILLLMCMVDAVIWTLDHAVELGLYDGPITHDWFRDTLGTALGWSEFALIATLAADVASHQGEPKSTELAMSVRSLATTGAMVWFLYFSFMTDWTMPVWPLRPRMMNVGTRMLCLAWLVVHAICLVQTSWLTLVAARCTARTLREMALADQAREVIPSRSEDGWDEMIRASGPKSGDGA